jgi:hypothetical protein
VLNYFSPTRITLLQCRSFLRIVVLRARKRAASISERRADGQEKTGEEKGSEKGQEKVSSLAGFGPRAETSSSDIALHDRPARFTAFRAVAFLETQFPDSTSHVHNATAR